MKFKDKYINEKENSKKADDTKILISNDAFAIGDMIEALINKIERTRRS